MNQTWLSFFLSRAHGSLFNFMVRLFISRIYRFLVADTQLYKRLCPSVRPLSVRPSVRYP